MATTPIKKIKMDSYFENLTVELNILYVLNINVKLRAN